MGMKGEERSSGDSEYNTEPLEHSDSANIEIHFEIATDTMLEGTPLATIQGISSPNFPDLNVSRKPLVFDDVEQEKMNLKMAEILAAVDDATGENPLDDNGNIMDVQERITSIKEDEILRDLPQVVHG